MSEAISVADVGSSMQEDQSFVPPTAPMEEKKFTPNDQVKEEPQAKFEQRLRAEEEISTPPLPQKIKGDPTRLIYEKLVVGRECNAMIIADAHTKEALLIDPGGDAETIQKWVKQLKVRVVQILVTHAHFDHIMAAHKVRKMLKAGIWLHSADLSLWRQLPEQIAFMGLKRRGGRHCMKKFSDPDHFLKEGTKLQIFDGITIHTPGHTPGSVCFYFPSYDLLISGDTLFKSHVGRTDLPGGDSAALRRSVFYKLYKLPYETRVLPGHGKETTIGYEMKNNLSCRICTCKSMKKKDKTKQNELPKHTNDCPSQPQKLHCQKSGNHCETHPTTSDSGCCEEAEEEGDHTCRCGANKIPAKHQHVGHDMCAVL